jgi:hypothetical protein
MIFATSMTANHIVFGHSVPPWISPGKLETGYDPDNDGRKGILVLGVPVTSTGCPSRTVIPAHQLSGRHPFQVGV